MTRSVKITWIDDDPGRITKDGWAEIFSTGVDTLDAVGELTTIAVQAEVIEQLDEWVTNVQDAPPNLIILDQNLTRVPNRRFGVNGSSLAHLLRLRLPKTPIVCVTAQEIESHTFDFEDLSEYTQVFSYLQLGDNIQLESLFAVALDYSRVCIVDAKSVRRAVVDTLKVPAIDRDSLLAILPEEFESNVVHGTSPHRIARWIINVLMRRPGFLSDSLEVATHLGLTEEALLQKVQGLFSSALYSGPFATPSRPLWWTSALNDVLYANVPQHVGLQPQYAGRKLPGIEAADYSRCIWSDQTDPPPDVVAYLDDGRTKRGPVRRAFTVPLAPDSILGFAPRLRMQGRGGKQ